MSRNPANRSQPSLPSLFLQLLDRSTWPLMVLVVIAMALILLAGCASPGKSLTDRAATWRVAINPDGSATVERGDTVRAQLVTPSTPAGPTTQSVNAAGVDTQIAGTYAPPEKPLAAYGLERRATWFYGGAVVVGVAGVVLIFTVWRSLGVGLLVFAGSLAAAPQFLDTYGVAVAGVGLVALLAAAAWSLRGYLFSHREHTASVASARKLAHEGKPEEAIAALRESPLVRTAWKGAS